MHISINNLIFKHSAAKIVEKIVEEKWIWKRDLMVYIGNFDEKSPFTLAASENLLYEEIFRTFLTM